MISRPLPFRSYQDHEHLSSRWSMSATTEDSDETSPPLPSTTAHPPPLPPALHRPNVPPALRPNHHPARGDPHLNNYFDEPPHSAMSSSTSTSSSPIFRCVTPSAATAPAYHNAFSSADSGFNEWLAAGPDQYTAASRRCGSTTSSVARLADGRHPYSPPRRHDDDDDDDAPEEEAADERPHGPPDGADDYPDPVHRTSIPIPPPSSLTLCSSSGWSCLARRSGYRYL